MQCFLQKHVEKVDLQESHLVEPLMTVKNDGRTWPHPHCNEVCLFQISSLLCDQNPLVPRDQIHAQSQGRIGEVRHHWVGEEGWEVAGMQTGSSYGTSYVQGSVEW